jgi:predicted transcriptional regulator
MFNDMVHVAPFGYEYERLLKPVYRSNPDVVVLINNGSKNDVRASFQDEAEKKLRKDRDIDLDTRECNIFEMYDSMETILEAISDYSDEDVYVNLATGTKVTAVSGMIACMATDADPFYVQSRLTSTATPDKRELPEFDEVVELPDYPIEKPTDDQIQVMKFIYNEGMGESTVRKKDIIEFADKEELEFTSGSENVSEKALYPRLDSRIIEPLSQKGFVETEKRGNTKRVSLTEDGEKAIRAFRHVV